MFCLASLEDTEDVDPEEAAGPDVDDPEAGGNNQEVEGLSRHPEEAGTLEGRDEFLSGGNTNVMSVGYNLQHNKLKVIF